MKRILCILILLLLPAGCALGSPLLLGEDLSGEIAVPYDESNPSAGQYVFRYRYPSIAESEPDAVLVNAFYEYLISDTLAFGLPMDSEYYAEIGESVLKEITYTVTCNSDAFFSVLIRTEETLPSGTSVVWTGHSFSRENGTPGSAATLPQLLGILATDENDTWLQDRQTDRADRLVRSMLWDQIQLNPDAIPYFDELSEEDLEGLFFPEEDFFLDETGNPVFYLEPGSAAPEDCGLLRFPISLEEIKDEM